MSNIIVQGWEWLEAELHKALEIVHQSTPPDGVKGAAKAAVTAVVEEAKAQAVAAATAAVEQAVTGVEGALAGAAEQAVGAGVEHTLSGAAGTAAELADKVGEVVDGAQGVLDLQEGK